MTITMQQLIDQTRHPSPLDQLELRMMNPGTPDTPGFTHRTPLADHYHLACWWSADLGRPAPAQAHFVADDEPEVRLMPVAYRQHRPVPWTDVPGTNGVEFTAGRRTIETLALRTVRRNVRAVLCHWAAALSASDQGALHAAWSRRLETRDFLRGWYEQMWLMLPHIYPDERDRLMMMSASADLAEIVPSTMREWAAGLTFAELTRAMSPLLSTVGLGGVGGPALLAMRAEHETQLRQLFEIR